MLNATDLQLANCPIWAWFCLMLFDWDKGKSERNLPERGFDFEFAARVFEDGTEEFTDERADYGETRMIAFGRIEAEMYAVVYTQPHDVRWIVSAFRCRPKELEPWKRRAAER